MKLIKNGKCWQIFERAMDPMVLEKKKHFDHIGDELKWTQNCFSGTELVC